MSKRVIRMSLDEKSIRDAIKELDAYKQWLKDCTKKLLDELAQVGVEVASARFANAAYDGTNDVTVQFETRSETKVAVVAVGSSTLFIEFGTGIRYPDNHPEAGAHGMVRGAYGHGLGKLKNGWRYSGDPGTNGEIIAEGKHAGEVHTYGNPANMSMYQTVRAVEEQFEEIARRCFV